MNIFPLAAVLALSFPAAAQSDAAFASALGKLPSGLATMAQLKTAPQAPAQDPVLGPPVAHDDWMAIINLMRAEAEYEAPEPGTTLSKWSLTDSNPEYRQMDIVFFGRPQGTFIAIGAAFFVAVKITELPNELRAETWIFTTDYLGRMKAASFQSATKAADGKITEYPLKELDFADPKVAARFDAIIKHWSE